MQLNNKLLIIPKLNKLQKTAIVTKTGVKLDIKA